MKTFKGEFVEYQRILFEQLTPFLYALHPLLQVDVVHALEGAGKLLSKAEETNSPLGVWALLPLLVAQYILPDMDERYAYRVAISVECLICALDLLDDIEDGDPTSIVLKLGPARVLNVSTTLLALTNHILLSLIEVGGPPERVTLLLSAVQDALISATEGQHRDILAEQRSAESFTSEECVEIAEGKAGSLMSLACRIGAIGAGANNEELAQFSELGRLLGIAHQLDNDSHDLYHILQSQQTSEAVGMIKTDLVRQKKTLPIVLAAHAVPTLHSYSLTTDEEKQKAHVDVLHEGIITTWGISLLYRERAHEQLRQIEKHHPISYALRLLLGFI